MKKTMAFITIMIALDMALLVAAVADLFEVQTVEAEEYIRPIKVVEEVTEVIEEEKAAEPREIVSLQPVVPIDRYHYTIAWDGKKISLDDFKLLCTTVYCESGNQSFNCQYLTALCILNRLVSENFPNTMREVVYQTNQFSVTNWSDFEERGFTDQVEQACFEAVIRNDHPENMYYFRTNFYFDWAVPYVSDGKVYFSTQKE